MFSSSDEVYDVSISWNYIPLSVTDNLSVGKWTKIERNNGKLLCVKTSLVDWRVYTWDQWVSKTIHQNHMGFSHIFSLSCLVWLCAPPFFSKVSTSSNKGRKLKRKIIFNWCLNLLFYLNFFSFGYSCFMIGLWLEIHGIFWRFFLLFNSVNFYVTAYNVVSLSQLSMILATLATEIWNIFNIFFALQKL